MVKRLNYEMKKFIKDLKQNIEDPETLDYVLKRTEKLFGALYKEIDEILKYEEEKMSQIQAKQDEQEKKLQELSLRLNDVCDDIYEDGMFFEIVCPYCNNEFEMNFIEKLKEINCPECNNIIELDWED